MVDDYKELIGKHLGRTSDGKTMKRYEQPEAHDASLLVAIPRNINRIKYNIVTDPVGYEVWHAYEFSFLWPNNQPSTGILKLAYEADSLNMVESKSLKLYLNSFDNEKFNHVEEVTSIIRSDLEKTIGSNVYVKLHFDKYFGFKEPFKIPFVDVDYEYIPVTSLEEDAKILFSDIQAEGKPIAVHTANLRSHCEITNQKDTGNSYIFYEGKNVPSEKALYRYIISLRNSQHFHENITEIIYDVLWKNFELKSLLVANFYARRGGIDIHSVRADTHETLNRCMENYHDVDSLFWKTFQQ